MNFLKNKRRLIVIGVDSLLFFGAFLLAWVLSSLTGTHAWTILPKYLCTGGLFFVFVAISRWVFRVYKNVWRYPNVKAYLDMVISDFCGGVVALIIALIINNSDYMIHAWQCVAIVVMFNCASLLSRFIYQYNYKLMGQSGAERKDSRITVAIVGAGRVGSLLADELLTYRGSYYKPVCFVDKNPSKVGGRVAGLPVYAEDESVIDVLASLEIQEIIIAIPQLSGEEADKSLNFYARTGCKVKLYDFPRTEDSVQEDGAAKRVIREFKIEDLLFRRSLEVTGEAARTYYGGKTVLVTGGGGSIGSELVRQIARCNPKKLIIFDIYENNAYDIQQELVRRYGTDLDLVVEIGSVRDRARLEAVFSNYRPDVVFHAAAHKHVPLMEHSNCEAIKNNVFGTYNTADMAEKYEVEKFILVSTDKAVNPTNVMGATKRMCEMVIQCRTDSKTAFSAVRFGNVLGSNGSVIPLFKRQIAAGGPLTVTDKRIIRYFMTIPEASGLVMQAGAMAKRGELFVLNMGKPVKIYDLAVNMVRLSGLRPDVDIKIVETGLRPGEKLYEELLIKTETLEKTPNDMIFIERDTPLSREAVEEKLRTLREVVIAAEGEIAAPSITEAMKSVVPTFHSPEEVNKSAESSSEMKEAAAIN